MEQASRQDHQEIVPDKLNYLPLLWPMCLFGGPLGLLSLIVVEALSNGGLFAGSASMLWDAWPYSIPISWMFGVIPAWLTWLVANVLKLRRGIKGSVVMGITGALVPIVLDWLFFGLSLIWHAFSIAGLLSALVFSFWLPQTSMLSTDKQPEAVQQ